MREELCTCVSNNLQERPDCVDKKLDGTIANLYLAKRYLLGIRRNMIEVTDTEQVDDDKWLNMPLGEKVQLAVTLSDIVSKEIHNLGNFLFGGKDEQ